MNYISILTGDQWVMEPGALERLAAQLSDPVAIAAVGKMELSGDGPDEPGYQNKDGIAHIAVTGVLMKEVPRIFQLFGVNATGYGTVSRAISDAEEDPNVSSIMLNVDSPGGSVSGIHAMADRIASSKKFVSAHIDSLGASGAYWMASQAKRLTAGRGAQVGSIGAYTARVDTSRAAENAGVKVHLFASGTHKGAGYPGTSLSQEQKDEIQHGVDTIHREFVADVSRGRGVSAQEIQQSADGRVFSAADAQKRGLIDGITSDPAKDFLMAKSLAEQQAYSKQIVDLCVEFPKHAALVKAAHDKEVSVEQIRGDIAIAEKSVQEAAVKIELEAKVLTVSAALDAEKAAHVATQTRLALVERERDALSLLSNGAKPAAAVKAEPVPKTVQKIPHAKYDAMTTPEKIAVGKLMGSGDVVIEG